MNSALRRGSGPWNGFNGSSAKLLITLDGVGARKNVDQHDLVELSSRKLLQMSQALIAILLYDPSPPAATGGTV